MKKRRLAWLCLFALCGAATVAPKRPVRVDVRIDVEAREASGLARGESVDPIGCRVVWALGMRSAICYAATTDASVSCVTRDAALVDAANAIRRGGFLRFAWDESGTCTSISQTDPSSSS